MQLPQGRCRRRDRGCAESWGLWPAASCSAGCPVPWGPGHTATQGRRLRCAARAVRIKRLADIPRAPVPGPGLREELGTRPGPCHSPATCPLPPPASRVVLRAALTTRVGHAPVATSPSMPGRGAAGPTSNPKLPPARLGKPPRHIAPAHTGGSLPREDRASPEGDTVLVPPSPPLHLPKDSVARPNLERGRSSAPAPIPSLAAKGLSHTCSLVSASPWGSNQRDGADHRQPTPNAGCQRDEGGTAPAPPFPLAPMAWQTPGEAATTWPTAHRVLRSSPVPHMPCPPHCGTEAVMARGLHGCFGEDGGQHGLLVGACRWEVVVALLRSIQHLVGRAGCRLQQPLCLFFLGGKARGGSVPTPLCQQLLPHGSLTLCLPGAAGRAPCASRCNPGTAEAVAGLLFPNSFAFSHSKPPPPQREQKHG